MREIVLLLRRKAEFKWDMHQLRYYVLGRKFTPVTDYAPLIDVGEGQKHQTAFARWFLEQYCHLKVEHRVVKDQGNADALSRHLSKKLGGRVCRGPRWTRPSTRSQKYQDKDNTVSLQDTDWEK